MSISWNTEYICYLVPEPDNSLHEDMEEGYYFRTEDEQLEGPFHTHEETEKNFREYCKNMV